MSGAVIRGRETSRRTSHFPGLFLRRKSVLQLLRPEERGWLLEKIVCRDRKEGRSGRRRRAEERVEKCMFAIARTQSPHSLLSLARSSLHPGTRRRCSSRSPLAFSFARSPTVLCAWFADRNPLLLPATASPCLSLSRLSTRVYVVSLPRLASQPSCVLRAFSASD